MCMCGINEHNDLRERVWFEDQLETQRGQTVFCYSNLCTIGHGSGFVIIGVTQTAYQSTMQVDVAASSLQLIAWQ